MRIVEYIKNILLKSRPQTKLVSQLSYIFLANLTLFVIVVVVNSLSGAWKNFYLLYYILPLLLSYYAFHLRSYLDRKLDELEEEIPRITKVYKLSEDKARVYLISKIENDVINQLAKFLILLIVLLAILIGLFSV